MGKSSIIWGCSYIFHSYVKLPEGNTLYPKVRLLRILPLYLIVNSPGTLSLGSNISEGELEFTKTQGGSARIILQYRQGPHLHSLGPVWGSIAPAMVRE